MRCSLYKNICRQRKRERKLEKWIPFEIYLLSLWAMSAWSIVYPETFQTISSAARNKKNQVIKLSRYLPWLTLFIIYLSSIKGLRVLYNLEVLKTAPPAWSCRPGCRNGKTRLWTTADAEKTICAGTWWTRSRESTACLMQRRPPASDASSASPAANVSWDHPYSIRIFHFTSASISCHRICEGNRLRFAFSEHVLLKLWLTDPRESVSVQRLRLMSSALGRRKRPHVISLESED